MIDTSGKPAASILSLAGETPQPPDDPPPLVRLEQSFGGSLVILRASTPRVLLHPDFAEALGTELIRRAERARHMRGGDDGDR